MGASNTVCTARLASRPVLTAVIRRIADSESPPRSKKESSHPDAVDPEDLGVDAGQDLLDCAGRGAMLAGGVFGRRQGTGIELAVDRHRQRVDHHYRRRDHIPGQPLGQLGADLGRIHGPGDIADEALVAGAVLAGDHGRVLDPVQLGQRRLDFAELDAVAADLDLVVGAAQVAQLPVGAPVHQVPGAIHALSWFPERARHEPRRRQAGPAQVADPDTGAGHIQLTDHPGGHRTQPGVQHKRRGPRHRRPDRRRP